MESLLVLVLFHSNFFEENDCAAVLIVWSLLLILLSFLCSLMKLCDLHAKSGQILLVLLVTCNIQCLTLLLYLALNDVNLLRDYRFYDKEDLAKANGVLQLGNQVFILLGHILDLLTKFLLDADEVSQL